MISYQMFFCLLAEVKGGNEEKEKGIKNNGGKENVKKGGLTEKKKERERMKRNKTASHNRVSTGSAVC